MRLSAIFFSLLVFFPIALASAQDQPASARPQQQSLDAGRGLTMLRLLTIVSGAFEALFGVAAMLATSMVTDALGTGADPPIFFARVLGAATLRIGVAALLARNELPHGGLAAAFGLTLYNVLAAIVILWTAAELGGASLWAVGIIHAVIGTLFVSALARRVPSSRSSASS